MFEQMRTLTPNRALDATVLLNKSSASLTATSNAPAPGTTAPEVGKYTNLSDLQWR